MSYFLTNCTGCGNTIFGDKFCTKCGLETVLFNNERTICPKCNTSRSLIISPQIVTDAPYAKFCGKCGFNFQEGMA